jgi:hypothetical protein
MNTTWQAESGNLECRWSGLLETSRYTPDWPQQTTIGPDENVYTSVPDFAAHSPFGSGEWFVPFDRRWSLPSR